MFQRKHKVNRAAGVKAPAYDPYNRYSNLGGGVFGFRKDKNVIIPGVTLDEKRRLSSVKDYVQKKTGQPCTLSDELIQDVYSMYVNEDIKRRSENGSNKVRHKILDKTYDSLTKIVTTDSPLYTSMMTRELAVALQKIDDQIKQEQEQNGQSPDGLETEFDDNDSGESQDGSGEGDSDQDDSQDGDQDGEESQNPGNSEGSGSGDSDSQEDDSSSSGSGDSSSQEQQMKSIDDILDSNATDDAIEQAKNKAEEKIKDLKEQLGTEAMKDLMDKDPDFLDKIENLKNQLSRVSINKESVKKFLEKILNESQNYFSPKYRTVEESLFDCDQCEDLSGLEFLHPIFGNSKLMDIVNESRVYKGKLDLYLDCSGSMGSYRDFEGVSMEMKDVAKGIAMVMFRMGLIENLYFFDTRLHQIKTINEISILSFNKNGGTCFDTVVNNIKDVGNNAVVVTDGDDYCSEYTKKAFWIGIGGTTFKPWGSGSSFDTYRGARQCVAYNSNTSKMEYCL
tara:strand:+ start:3789 stop:5309 length:1521 start_codon:yes stop_codon:yes gene_type:complete